MSIDLTAYDGPLFYFVASLCDEAGICRTGNEYGNRVEIHAATYDVENGLVVTDREGRTFRLRITPEQIPAVKKGCQYDLAWRGKCDQPSIDEKGFCGQHSTLSCVRCGSKATRECEETFLLVCGMPLCDGCKCRCLDRNESWESK